MSIKLAEALLRRKELQEKLNRIGPVKEAQVYEVKAKRVRVTDDLDDLIASVPKLTLSQVTSEYDHYAKQLRLVDAAIQQANWTTEMPGIDACFVDYEAKQ